MAGPTLQVEPPVRQERVGGLSSVVPFRQNDRLGLGEKLVFQSDGCEFPQTEESRCYAADTPADKTFAGTDIADAATSVVTLYAGVVCHAAPDADELQRSEDALMSGRDQVLEGMLAEWADGGTAITAGTSPKNAVGRIEQALDKGYRGRGLILMSRLDALDAGLEYTEGEYLRTKAGTPVVASGWVDPGTVYGLGAVTVEHGSLEQRDVIEPKKNKHWALSEQEHAILVDCEFRIKSTITA